LGNFIVFPGDVPSDIHPVFDTFDGGVELRFFISQIVYEAL
jgi:hypothetical protein